MTKQQRKRFRERDGEVAMSLLDSAIDRDQVIVLESQLLELANDRQSQQRLAKIKDQAFENAEMIRKVMVFVEAEGMIASGKK